MSSSALLHRMLVSCSPPPPPLGYATRHDRLLLTCGRPYEAACADDGNMLDSRGKVDAATQLRDNLDVFTNMASYSIFLKRVMPVFVNILNGPCIFQSNSNEQVCLLPFYRVFHGLVLTFDCRNSETPSSKSSTDSLHIPPRPNRSNHMHSRLWSF